MRGRTCTLVAASLFLICVPSRADFKYTQSGQFTNGVDKAKAAFDAQATEVTIYVKSASLRIDLPDGTYGIIDLEGQRDIEVDPKARTYSVVKFDDIRARDKAASQQFPSHITEDARLTVTSTGKTQTLRPNRTGHKHRIAAELGGIFNGRFLDRAFSRRLQRSERRL